MTKTAVFIAALALVLAPMTATAQDKSVPQPKKSEPVCVPANLTELPPDSPEMFMVTIAKSIGRSISCTKCTKGDQIRFFCVLGCSPGGTC